MRLLGMALLLVFALPNVQIGAALAADWVVTGREIKEGGTVALSRNLVVERGGELTLRSVKLTIQNTYHGQFGIRVKSGGRMTVESGSAITAASDSGRFSFVVETGAGFAMTDSSLTRCGWGLPGEDLGYSAALRSGARGLAVDAADAVIRGNTLSGNHVGIVLTGSGITVDGNRIESNEAGIYVKEAADCRITRNTIHHSSSGGPVNLLDAQNNRIEENTITLSKVQVGVITGVFSSRNTIANNHISGLGMGIMMIFVSSDNLIRNNTISTDEAGIMVSGWNNIIEGNTINDSVEQPGTGIYLVNAFNSTVSQNRISGSAGQGLWVRHSSNNALIGNHVSGVLVPDRNRVPIGLLFMSTSRHNVIYGNTVEGFSRGLAVLYSSDRNTIASNRISATLYQSVLVDDSTDNLAYGNAFLDPGGIPYDNGKNRWDQGGMGNYWSAYRGTDAGGDGTGDTPYPIPPSGTDLFPLMAPPAVASLPVPTVTTAAPPKYASLLGKSVTGEEVIENQTIVLNNLNVESGGSLTLRNVDLITGASPLWSNLTVSTGGSLKIYNCRIRQLDYSYGFGLLAYKGSEFVMKDSELINCGDEYWSGGLEIYADNAVVENNVLKDSIVSFLRTRGGRLTGNTLSGSLQGVIIEGSDNVAVTGNTIRNCIEYAASAWESTNILIADNRISNILDGGIGVWLSSNSRIRNNTISGMHAGSEGIFVHGAGEAASGNTISDCSVGLILHEGSVAEDNRISGCITGLELEAGSVVTGNVVSRCDEGARLRGAASLLRENTFQACGLGIRCDFTGENAIYQNNFLANTVQASAAGNANQWDDGSRGNFWSDYRGSDADLDGIGDTPYAIGSDAVDRYPLMNPSTNPVPDVRANGLDGLAVVPAGTPVQIAVRLTPGGLAGRNGDLWMGGLATIDGTDYWLTVEEGGLWRLGIYPFRQAPLGILAPTEILDLPLPKGNYHFFFVADSEMDGLPSVNWWDVVQVRVD